MVRFGSRAVSACFALVLTALVPDARAQLYLAGNLAVDFVNDSDISASGSGTNGSGNVSYKTGFGGSGALGLALGRFRIEAEAFYRTADLENLTVSTSGMQLGTVALATGDQSANGDLRSYGALGNIFYDIYTGTGWVPYIGAGAGFARLALKVDSVGATATGFDESEWVLAYQAGFGVAYQVSPSFAFTVGYRYFATADATFSVNGTENEIDFSAHVLQTGVRYKF